MPSIADGIDVALKEWATDRQIEYIDYINAGNNITSTALHFNVARSSVQRSIWGLIKRATIKGYSPQHDMVHPVPDPFIVKGISTYYNKDGERAGSGLNPH